MNKIVDEVLESVLVFDYPALKVAYFNSSMRDFLEQINPSFKLKKHLKYQAFDSFDIFPSFQILNQNLKDQIFEDCKLSLKHKDYYYDLKVKKLKLSKKTFFCFFLMEKNSQSISQKVLARNEFKYRSLFNNMMDGFSYQKIIFDDNGKAKDFIYLNVNDAFEKITGLKKVEVVGKKVSEIIPEIRESHFEWMDIYTNVALNGKAIDFEEHSKTLDRWFKVSAYSPEKGCFATIFRDITQEKKSRLLLQESLLEKDILLKEIHHRVKNNLQLISSILGLEELRAEKSDVKNVLKACKNRVHSMFLIHQYLYQYKTVSKIKMKGFMQNLSNLLKEAYQNRAKNIDLYLDLDDLKFPLNIAVPCGLILNELITNSLKYAFEKLESGTLKVFLKKEKKSKYLYLEVHDDGKGLDKKLLNNDEGESRSLGLKLVEMLAEQIKGKFIMQNLESGGLCSKIVFTL